MGRARDQLHALRAAAEADVLHRGVRGAPFAP
jgi:hypothetical protein